MSTIRAAYSEKPKFEATDNHPDAVEYEIEVDGVTWWVHAIDGEPTESQVRDMLAGSV